MAFIDTVKQWFVTGAYPTQAQFWQKFAYLRWKDEPIAIVEVTGLQSQLNSLGSLPEKYDADGSDIFYDVNEGYELNRILWQSPVPASPSCMYDGGEEGDIIAEGEVPLLKDSWMVAVFATATTEKIIVKGVPNGGKVYFIKRKIIS